MSNSLHRYLISGIKTESGKNRVIPLREEIIPLIETNISKYNNIAGKYALNSLISYIPKATDKHSSHDCRHTFIASAKMSEIENMLIKKMVGHASGVTNDVYTHIGHKELVKNVDKIAFI